MIYIISLLLLLILVQLRFIHVKLSGLVRLSAAVTAEEYKEAVQTPKTKKLPLEAVKQKFRGRSVTKTDDLVDIADLPWEEAYKIVEDIGK